MATITSYQVQRGQRIKEGESVLKMRARHQTQSGVCVHEAAHVAPRWLPRVQPECYEEDYE